MKKYYLLFIFYLIISVQFIFSDINAITETGDEVILYENGTWAFLNNIISLNKDIKVNKNIFKKSDESSFLIKSKIKGTGIWINPKKWSFSKGSDDIEYNFQLKGESLYGMFISEKIQIPISTVKEAAIENARRVASNIKINKQEIINVNDIEVLMLQFTATIQDVNFIYYGYFYSNDNGTFQLITYTGENLFYEYLHESLLFLNGLSEY